MKRCVYSGHSTACWIKTSLAIASLIVSSAAWGRTDGIPTQPTAPPTLFNKPAPKSFHCQRLFTIGGKVYGLDSDVHPDGEGLRAFLKGIPAATAELNTYQRNRAALKNTAYVGSLGIAVVIAGLVAGGGGGKEAMIIGGSSIFGGSLIYGFASLHANESHLDEAVRLHNEARPAQPIRLQFSTGISF